MRDTKSAYSCEMVREKLADYSVNNLGWFDSRKVRAHLQGCAPCTAELELLHSAVEMVEDIGHREPPPGLWNGVYNTLTADEASTRSRSNPAPRRLGRHALSVVSGVLLVLMVVGVMTRMNRPMQVNALDTAAYEYVEAHAVLAQDQPFADRISLSLVAAGAGEVE